MAFTLQISFRGVAALVDPDHPSQQARERHEALFLLPDIRLGDTIAEHDLPPHPARVSFEADGESRTWFLDQEELSILTADGNPLSGQLSSAPSLDNVVSLSEVSQGLAQLNQNILSAPKSSDILAGSFRVGSGKLAGGPLSESEWEFRESRDAPAVVRSQFAESIEVEILIEHEFVHLISKGLEGLERKAEIRAVGDSEKALIRVSNRCDSQLDRDNDPDFLGYYRLIPQYAGPLRFPFRATSPDTLSRAISSSGCIPARS